MTLIEQIYADKTVKSGFNPYIFAFCFLNP